MVLVVWGVLLCALELHAATTLHRWTGAGANGRWSTPANWLNNSVPSGGDQRLIFLAGSARKTNTNDLAPGAVFESIWILDQGYNIYGNSLSTTLIRRDDTTGSSTFRPNIVLTGALTVQVELDAGLLVLEGDLQLGPHNCRCTGRGDLTISGVVTGTGGIAMNGSGRLRLAGEGANTYSGLSFLNGGTMELGRFVLRGATPVGTTAIPGDLVIGNGGSGVASNTVTLLRDNQIANTSKVTVNSNGELRLSGNDDSVGDLVLNAGRVSTGTGLLSLAAGAIVQTSSGTSWIDGRLNLGLDPQRVFDVDQNGFLRVEASVAGAAGVALVKTNRGSLFLAASNTFLGPVEIWGGTVWVTDGHALGETNGATVVRLGNLVLDSVGTPAEILHAKGPAAVLRLAGSSAAWNGPVILDDDLTIFTPSPGFLNIFGPITGPSGMTKLGEGILQFKTTVTNDFAGTLRVPEGRLILDGVFHQPVITGPLIIGNTNDPPGSQIVSSIKNHQIRDDVPVRVLRSGLLSLGPTKDRLGPITLIGGDLATSAGGVLTLGADVSVEPSDRTATIEGTLDLGGASRVIQVASGDPSVECRISANIQGGPLSAFTKTGLGILELAGANDYEGHTEVAAGQLRVSHSQALGALTGDTRVANGARLGLSSGVVVDEGLVLNGSGGGATAGALLNVEDTNRWTGPILLETASVVSVYGVIGNLTLSGSISGPGRLTKGGPRPLVLAGSLANTFGGNFEVVQGLVRLVKNNDVVAVPGDLIVGDGGAAGFEDVVQVGAKGQIEPTSAVTLRSSGLLDLANQSAVLGSLEGEGMLSLGGGFLRLGSNHLSRTFSGVLTNDPNANGMTKIGQGVQTFTGTSPFHNLLDVVDGGLVVNGSLPNAFVRARDRGFVGGIGSMQHFELGAGGRLVPGTSPGRITAATGADLLGGDVGVELNGPVVAVDYDQVRSGGAVKLAANLSLTVGFVPAVDQSFLILEKIPAGPLNGTFAGLPNGAEFVAGGFRFRIRYDGGNGNDVVVTRVAGAAPSLGGITVASDGTFTLQGQGIPGLNYVVEAAASLNFPILWTPLATLLADGGGVIQFVDPQATLFPVRFYRLREP